MSVTVIASRTISSSAAVMATCATKKSTGSRRHPPQAHQVRVPLSTWTTLSLVQTFKNAVLVSRSPTLVQEEQSREVKLQPTLADNFAAHRFIMQVLKMRLEEQLFNGTAPACRGFGVSRITFRKIIICLPVSRRSGAAGTDRRRAAAADDAALLARAHLGARPRRVAHLLDVAAPQVRLLPAPRPAAGRGPLSGAALPARWTQAAAAQRGQSVSHVTWSNFHIIFASSLAVLVANTRCGRCASQFSHPECTTYRYVCIYTDAFFGASL